MGEGQPRPRTVRAAGRFDDALIARDAFRLEWSVTGAESNLDDLANYSQFTLSPQPTFGYLLYHFHLVLLLSDFTRR